MNAHYGTPANIRAPGRIPGGSSSGSAAAAAAGVCDFALGSDTGGSVRIPASLCGLYGIRTTHGRIDTKGVMDMSPSFDTIGWLAATRGRVPQGRRRAARRRQRSPAPVQNLLIADDGFAEADAPVVALLQRRACRDGRRAAEAAARARSRRTDLDAWRDAVRIIQAYEIWQVYGRSSRETAALRPGRRRAHAGRLEDHQGRGRRRAQSPRRRPRAHPRADHARHRRGAAERALHRAEDRHAGGRDGRLPHPRHAADLHRGARRPAAGVDPGRHRRRLPGRTVVHRLGRRRRSAARSRGRRCRSFAGSSERRDCLPGRRSEPGSGTPAASHSGSRIGAKVTHHALLRGVRNDVARVTRKTPATFSDCRAAPCRG